MPEENILSLDYGITFACLNQVEYTRQCLDSLLRTGVDPQRIVAVDNCSSDDTEHFLRGLHLGGYIRNKQNLGCGTAWNQGVLMLQTEWTVVMNNDVIVSNEWLENLIGFCKVNNISVASPAMIEGPELDYDLNDFTSRPARVISSYARRDYLHAVCLVVHESVWQRAGYFRSKPSLIGYEDALFFSELKRLNIPRATTGSSWLHHFGSITQKAMKMEQKLTGRQTLGDRLDPELRREFWLARKLRKHRERSWLSKCRESEIRRFGMTVHGHRERGETEWV
jgi:GT2 family glycosyltransferase